MNTTIVVTVHAYATPLSLSVSPRPMSTPQLWILSVGFGTLPSFYAKVICIRNIRHSLFVIWHTRVLSRNEYKQVCWICTMYDVCICVGVLVYAKQSIVKKSIKLFMNTLSCIHSQNMYIHSIVYSKCNKNTITMPLWWRKWRWGGAKSVEKIEKWYWQSKWNKSTESN